MNRVIIVLALLMTTQFAFPANAQKASKQNTARSKRSLKGVVIKNNRAKLKRGYMFVRESPNLVAVKNKATGITTDAKFECRCRAGGNCHLKVLGQQITCDPSECDVCSLEIILIPPPSY
jgi:predicted secreted protein